MLVYQVTTIVTSIKKKLEVCNLDHIYKGKNFPHFLKREKQIRINKDAC